MQNKLIISVDGVRRDRFSCYNPKMRHVSPHIYEIAQECVVFDDVMAAATSTAMCFSSIFTGRYPVEFGRKTYGDSFNPFPDNLFSDHEKIGYSTFCCLNRRFETSVNMANAFSQASFLWTGSQPKSRKPGDKHRASLKPQQQAEYLIANLQSVKEPWLAWIHIHGFSAPGEKFRTIVGFDYDCRVAEMDSAIGMLFEKFRDVAEIFIFADHGYAFFEHGKWAYGKDGHNLVQPVVAVPLLVYNAEQRGRNPNLVSQTRIRDIVLNSSQCESVRDQLCFCETRYIGQWDKALAIRKGQFKLVYYYDSGKSEFYDLLSDGGETINYGNGRFHRLSRDSTGDHPQLKPYIIRSDWDAVRRAYNEMLNLARSYYGTRVELVGDRKARLKARIRRTVALLRKRRGLL